MIRSFLSMTQFYYEIIFAPFLAERAPWVLWPLYFLCRVFRICFVVNIASTTGHIVIELDYFFRSLILSDIDPRKRYVWLKKPDPYSSVCTKLYGDRFWFSSCSRYLYLLFLPLTMAFPDLVFDAGISRLKWQLPKTRKRGDFDKGASYLHQVSKEEAFKKIVEAYRKIKRSPWKFPLKEVCFDKNKLKKLVSVENKKVALIHIKDVVRNAVALPTDPVTYLDALEYLENSGYSLIFIGREKMPPIFKKYEIVNYAESSIADFYHDLYLFSIADIALISASGVSVLADSMNVPYLYLNSWHLSIPPFSAKSISIPALMKRISGEWISFAEQNRIYKSLADIGPENFPHAEYIPRNASSEEILMAVKELLLLKVDTTPLSSLQSLFKRLDLTSPLSYSESRCSDFFLRQHKNLFGEKVRGDEVV